jgi:hypothetical protein
VLKTILSYLRIRIHEEGMRVFSIALQIREKDVYRLFLMDIGGWDLGVGRKYALKILQISLWFDIGADLIICKILLTF